MALTSARARRPLKARVTAVTPKAALPARASFSAAGRAALGAAQERRAGLDQVGPADQQVGHVLGAAHPARRDQRDERAPAHRGEQCPHGPVLVRDGRRWPGCPGGRRPPRPAGTARRAPPAAPTTASSGVVTVSRTAEPAACSARDDVGRRDAEGEADHGGRRGQERVDLAGVVVVVPRRLAERHPDDGGVGLELRDVGGQALGIGRRGARDEEVHAERVDAGGPDGRHLLGQAGRRLVPAGEEAQRARPAVATTRSTVDGPPAMGATTSGQRETAPDRRECRTPRTLTHRPLRWATRGPRPRRHAAQHRCRPPIPPRAGRRRGAGPAARHRPLRAERRQPPGLAGHRRQGPRRPRRAARPLPERMVRVPGHGVGRPGALGAGDRPCGRGGGRRQRRRPSPRPVPPHPASPRRSIPLPPSCSSWPTCPRWPRSTATSPATPWSAAPPSTPSSGACCWRRGPRGSAAS